MKPLMIPEDCEDGFLAAFWKRPSAYLEDDVRQSISAFSRIDHTIGMQRLASDLESGRWAEKNSSLALLKEFDAGYRLITARIKDE